MIESIMPGDDTSPSRTEPKHAKKNGSDFNLSFTPPAIQAMDAIKLTVNNKLR